MLQQGWETGDKFRENIKLIVGLVLEDRMPEITVL